MLIKQINKLIPVAACLLLTIRLFAQTPSLKLGVPLINRDYNLDKIVYEDKLSFFMLAHTLEGNTRVFLKRFSIKDFTLENDVELSVPDAPGKKLVFEGLQAIKDRLYLFSSYYDKEKRSNTLFVNSIDRNAKPDGELKEIDVTTEATRKFHGIYDLQVSKKETKIMTYREQENFEKEPVNFTLKVFDNAFKLLWKKNVELKYTNEEYDFKSYSVDDNGNAYVFALVKLSAEEKKKHDGDFFKDVLFVFSNEHGFMTEYPLLPPDNSMHLINAQYTVNDKNEVIAAGGYDIENKMMKVKMSGSFFYKFDLAKPEPLVYRATPLSDTFLNTWMQDKKMQRSSLLEQYRSQTVYPTDDGGAIAMYATEDRGGHSGPVIIIRYKEDGSVAWEKIILKDQPGGMDNYAFSSQASFYDTKNLYIIYNDHPGNSTVKQVKEVKEVEDFEKESTIVVKSVSADGTIADVQLPWKSAEVEKIIFMPRNWFDIKPGLAYIEVWGAHCKSSATGKSAKKCKMIGRISTITE